METSSRVLDCEEGCPDAGTGCVYCDYRIGCEEGCKVQDEISFKAGWGERDKWLSPDETERLEAAYKAGILKVRKVLENVLVNSERRKLVGADNYIVIRKEGDSDFKGYYQSASVEEQFKRVMFTAATLEDAIRKAQSEYTEHGYRVVGLGACPTCGLEETEPGGLVQDSRSLPNW